LIDRHKNLVFTLSLQMLKNKEEAEEAAQDTFLKVYKSLKKFNPHYALGFRNESSKYHKI